MKRCSTYLSSTMFSRFNSVVSNAAWILICWSISLSVLAQTDTIFEFERLVAGDPANSTVFGRSVAAADGVIVIGDPFNSENGLRSGAAYVFEQADDGTWGQTAKLVASDIEPGFFFGFSVDVSPTRVVVGASQEQVDFGRGAVYVFERDSNGNWFQSAKLEPSGSSSRDQFGAAVSISGDRLAVGAWGDDTQASRAGAAYVFDFDQADGWLEAAKLFASDPSTEDWFGFSLALDNDRLLIGASLDTNSELSTGSAYIFEVDGNGDWVQSRKLVPDDGIGDDRFGESVSLFNDIALIGAPDQIPYGAAYVFGRDNSGDWVQEEKLPAPEPEGGGSRHKFGGSVSVQTGKAVVGAHQLDASILERDVGAVYIFEQNSAGNWGFTATLLASQPSADDELGFGVDSVGGLVVAGAPQFALGNLDLGPGSAYLFSVQTGSVPAAPVNVSAIAGDAQATVSWTAPTDTGGSAITGYTVTSSPGDQQCITSGATSCTVTGLTNGTAYTFTVVATSAIGDSPGSTPSNTVTPTGSPGAPINVTAAAGDGQASVSWTAPTDTGGSAITGYTVTSSPDNQTCSTSGATTCTVTGLVNGTAYTFTVVATTAAGDGPPSEPSEPITPAGPPDAPLQVVATPGPESLVVSWLAPSDNGGAPVIRYLAEANPTCEVVAIANEIPGSTPYTCTIRNLRPEQEYRVTVVAINSSGESAPAAASEALQPLENSAIAVPVLTSWGFVLLIIVIGALPILIRPSMIS